MLITDRFEKLTVIIEFSRAAKPHRTGGSAAREYSASGRNLIR